MQTQLNAAQIAALKSAGLLPNTVGETEAKAKPVHPLAHLDGQSLNRRRRNPRPLARIRVYIDGKGYVTKGVFWVGRDKQDSSKLRVGACNLKQNGTLYQNGKFDGTVWRSEGEFEIA